MPRLRFPPWHKIARDCNAGEAPQAGEPQLDTVGGACAGAGFIRPSSGLKPIKTPVAEGHGEPIREVRVMYPILAPVALAPPDGAHGVAGFVAGELETKRLRTSAWTGQQLSGRRTAER